MLNISLEWTQPIYKLDYLITFCLVSLPLCAPKRVAYQDFPGGAVVKNLPANAGNMGSIAGAGRSHMPRSD